MADEPEQVFCPACKTLRPKLDFECLPLDLRCKRCIPVDTAMELYDKRVQQAGQKIAQIVDSAGTARSLRPLERLLDGIYDSWGGVAVLCEDAVRWAKDMGENPRTKGQALKFITNLLAIHAKVEKTKIDDDWNQMSKDEIKAKLTLRLTEIMMQSEAPAAKQAAIKQILGGND